MRRIDWLLVLIFLAIGLAVLAPIVPQAADRIPYPAHSPISDLTLTHWSAFEYTRYQLAATGQVPLWRTSILSGTPFAANPLAGLFYPPHWLALLTRLPLALALNILLWLHFSLAAAAMYGLMRHWEVSRGAALVAALAYAAAPKIVAHMGLGHLTLVEAWAWLPLVLALTPTHPRRGKTATGVGAGAALGMCALADARLAIYGALLAISYVIVLGTRRNRRAWLNVMGRVTVTGVVALTVSAAAWLPTLALSSDTSRAALAPQEAGTLSLDPVYLLGLLIADRSGAAERTTYVGLSVLALAIVALLTRQINRRLRLWLLGVIVVGAIMALGTHTPLYDVIYRVPGASLLRVPARAWFMVTLACAVLAGLGAQRVGERVKRQTLVRIVIGAAIALDLLPVDWAVYRAVNVDEAFAAGREAAAWLAEQPGEFRVYSPSLSIPQHVAQQFNLQLADGVDPLQLAWYVAYMQTATGVGAWDYSVTLPPFLNIETDDEIATALKDVLPDARRLGLLNVKYVAAAFPIASSDLIERARFGATRVYENLQVQPRAFMATRIDLSGEATGRDRAVVEGLPFPVDLNVAGGEVRTLTMTADRLEFEAEGPGLLVLSEVYAPDWAATLDGAATAIWRTDGTLRGVLVPWGWHTVELVYQPRRVLAGAIISGLSVIACAGAVCVQRMRRRMADGGWRDGEMER
jgi:hypothetical protein